MTPAVKRFWSQYHSGKGTCVHLCNRCDSNNRGVVNNNRETGDRGNVSATSLNVTSPESTRQSSRSMHQRTIASPDVSNVSSWGNQVTASSYFNFIIPQFVRDNIGRGIWIIDYSGIQMFRISQIVNWSVIQAMTWITVLKVHYTSNGLNNGLLWASEKGTCGTFKVRDSIVIGILD